MTLYEFLKFLHVLFAIVAVGFNLSYGYWLSRVPNDPERAAGFLRGVKALDDRFANPAYVLLLLTGLGMVFEADIPFSTFWIWASLVLYGAVVLGGLLVFTPTLRRQVALADAGSVRTDAYRAVAVRGGIGGGMVTALVVIIVFFMVTKPTL